MPPRKPRRPSKEDIKAKADRAEGKKSAAREDYDPLNPPEEVEDLEEMPGGVMLKRKGGRPAYKYNPQYAVIAAHALQRGATVSELAQMFGVQNATIWKWRQTHEEFDNAFPEFGSRYDERVERALAERAVGYSYNATKFFNYQGTIVSQEYIEHVPPDLTAIKMWLSARKPDKWRVKDEVEITAGGAAFVEILKNLGNKNKEE